MNSESLLYDLLVSINCFAKYLDINPRVDLFNDTEIMISFPDSAYNPVQLLDDLEKPFVFIENHFDVMFSGYDMDRNYIDMPVNIKKRKCGTVVDYQSISVGDVLLTDFMIRLFIQDSKERSEIFSVIEEINFLSSSCFVIERNEYTKKYFTSDLEGTSYIFISLCDDSVQIKKNIVKNMTIGQMKSLFDRYFITKQDSLEFYYIFEYSSFCSSLLIALRLSMADNGIRLKNNLDSVEFYSDTARVYFNYDTEVYAEKVMLALLFGNSQRKGIARL